MKKLYLPNVAYELLIDGKYHYYGSHCRSKKIYESQIKANSGNKLAAACNRGELSRAEYNTRVEVINVWEFNTAEEALDKELELITSGKQQYGDLLAPT